VYAVVLAALLAACASAALALQSAPPQDFPHFRVPGFSRDMESLRSLFWLHYPGASPKATLWDEWLSTPGLWPAVDTGGQSEAMRRAWAQALQGRVLDAEGYVATHQHASIAHQLGWPFPFWTQGTGGMGWHFSFKDTIGPGWRPDRLSTSQGWRLMSLQDGGMGEWGWRLQVAGPGASLETPPAAIDAFQSPFLQIRWKAEGVARMSPFVEWAAPDAPEFGPERRMYFDPPPGQGIVYTMVPVHRHPRWTGRIARIRIGLGNASGGGIVTLQALFTQYDTRHTINAQNFVRGCAYYFWWTRDLPFLRASIQRMRTALRFVLHEHQPDKHGAIHTDWIGHDGRSGLQRDADGRKHQLPGHGIGGNYWDLLPFGHLDAYATIHHYDAVRVMARLEREVAAHPEWNVPGGFLALDPAALERHAQRVRSQAGRLFWNPATGRFAALDADGRKHDYGFTFLNLEAVHYGIATPAQAKSILAWLSGERIVPYDTSTGADIYHWRFAPRATTRRNVDWYGWFWSGPETIPWGGQVQDGGAVLGFSYHDLMARLRTRGPDDAWRRLREIVRWHEEVRAAGGYRSYYDGRREGTLQGGGTAGGLGLDQEFFESVLVPQVMLLGFLGFQPTGDGFLLHPRLPREWPELSIDRIRLHDRVLAVTVRRDSIDIRVEGHSEEPLWAVLPEGEWRAAALDSRGSAGTWRTLSRRDRDRAVRLDLADPGVRLQRGGSSQ